MWHEKKSKKSPILENILDVWTEDRILSPVSVDTIVFHLVLIHSTCICHSLDHFPLTCEGKPGRDGLFTLLHKHPGRPNRRQLLFRFVFLMKEYGAKICCVTSLSNCFPRFLDNISRAPLESGFIVLECCMKDN